MKIVISRCYGGFGISDTAFERYLDLKGVTWYKGESEYGSSVYYNVPVKHYEALYELCKAKPVGPDRFKEVHGLSLSPYDIERTDPILVQVVEELGEESWAKYAELKIVDVPDDIQWEIDDYDGMESISEVHRRWY